MVPIDGYGSEHVRRLLRSRSVGELRGEAIEGEGAEQIAAHAGFDLAETAGGGLDPVEADSRGHGGELALEIDVADELRGFGFEEEKVFEEGGGGAEERCRFSPGLRLRRGRFQ